MEGVKRNSDARPIYKNHNSHRGTPSQHSRKSPKIEHRALAATGKTPILLPRCATSLFSARFASVFLVLWEKGQERRTVLDFGGATAQKTTRGEQSAFYQETSPPCPETHEYAVCLMDHQLTCADWDVSRLALKINQNGHNQTTKSCNAAGYP